MGSTNFQLWNPTQANQESDAAYTSDAQRVGGAPNGTAFPSQTANKLFYQVSCGITALMQMMATKGFTVDDTNISTLASVLSAILTSADLRGQLQSIAYSSVIAINAAAFNGFEISLSGNTTLNVTGQSAGQIITFIFVQDVAGSHVVTWPSSWESIQPDPTSSTISVITMAIGADLIGRFQAPAMSPSGINSTAIGLGQQSTARFITPASSDNSTNAATTAWVRTFVNALNAAGYSISLTNPGYILFPTFLGGLIIEWGLVGSTSGGSGSSISFPKTFPNSVLAVVANNTSTNNANYVFTNGVSNSGFTLINDGNGAGAYWLAFGY
jgi:hypothetical protein